MPPPAVTHGDQLTSADVGPWAIQGVSRGSEVLDSSLSTPGRGFFRFDTPAEFTSSTAWPSNANDSNPGVLNNTSLHMGQVTGSPVTIDGYSIPVGTLIVQFEVFPDGMGGFYAQNSSVVILFRGCRFRSTAGIADPGLFNDNGASASQQIMMHYCDIGLASKDPPAGTTGLVAIGNHGGLNHRYLRNYHTISATYYQPNVDGIEITENWIDEFLYAYGDGGVEAVLPNPNAGHLNGISSEGGRTSIKILRNHILAPSPDGATGSSGTALGQPGYGTQPTQSGYGAGTAPGRLLQSTDIIALFSSNGQPNLGNAAAGGLQIRDNLLGGTGYVLYAGNALGNCRNVNVSGNKFTTKWWTNSAQFDVIRDTPAWGTGGNVAENNTWADDYGTGGDGTTALANRQYPSGNGPRAGTAAFTGGPVPITLVGAAGTEWPGGGPATSYTVSRSTTGGNTLVLAFGLFGPSGAVPAGLSITDSASNTWHYSTSAAQEPPYGQVLASTGDYVGSFIAWCIGAAAVTSVTIHVTNAIDFQGVLSEWSGIVSAETGASATDPSTTSAVTSPSVTVGNAADLVIAHTENSGGWNSTTGTQFSVDGPAACYSLPGATGPFTFTWGNSGHGAAVAVQVFSPVAAATGTGVLMGSFP